MADFHPQLKNLLNCISLEMKEQEKRYSLESSTSLKELKSIGVVMHPINVIRKSFGYADYPEIGFKLPFSSDTSSFRDNSAIECFIDGENPVKGVLLNFDGRKGELRLFAPDFPDWIEDKGVGVKLSPDHHTSEVMRKALGQLEESSGLLNLFEKIHGEESFGKLRKGTVDLTYTNDHLNKSQRNAVRGIVENDSLMILHGPPGTGKTTTLVEGIVQLVKEKKKILVTAPSNAAVDNIAKGLVNNDVRILRVGNALKTDDVIYPFTPEGRLSQSKEVKDIKKLRIKSEEFRKMALQYKRNFGKADREQRKLLFNESKKIRKQIKELRTYFDSKLYDEADVIIGTPIGVYNFLPSDAEFDALIMDEAGQSIEPMAWVVFPFSERWVLAGDPFQLPPTVLSEAAKSNGLDVSILERGYRNCENLYFLDTQYRMRESIAEFSNKYFYDGKLITPERLKDVEEHIVFYDTAGTGFNEKFGAEGVSLVNEGEVDIVEAIINNLEMMDAAISVISPYSGQVGLLKNRLSKEIRVSTVDSFQGQENDVIIVSMVRSNNEAIIGFLKDYRRMNVAITRAKEKLFIIGDSATIGQDKFYAQLLELTESINGYRSAWELMNEQ